MTRLKSLTKKQLRAFIAVLVALCVAVPSMIVLIVKGASAAEGTKLDFNSGNSYTITVGSDGLASGTYNVTYDGRTYVYDLDFNEDGSRLNDALVEGDTLVFDTSTKKITWTYTPTHTGIVNATSLMTASESGDTVSLALNSGETLVAGTTYYYYDSSTETYYLFTIADDELGYTAGDSTGGSHDSLTYYYERTLTDAARIESSENPITVSIDTSDGSATISGDQLKRRQIYVKTDEFTDGGVYLIRSASDGVLLQSGTSKDSDYTDDGDSSFDNCDYQSTSHSYYNIGEDSTDLSTYTSGTFYDASGTTIESLGNYYDGGDSEADFALSEFRAQSKSHSVDYGLTFIGTYSTETVSGFYLFGYDQNGETSSNPKNCYTSDKTLGKIFNTNETEVKLFNLCEGKSRIKSGIQGRDYNHNDNSIWKYDSSNSKLYTRYRTLDGTDVVANNYLQKETSGTYTMSASTSSTFDLYQRQSVYEQTDYEGLDTVDSDKLVSKTVTARSVTYAETESNDNGLELKKTVTDNGDDTFSVQLEAWTTSEKLTLPETDVALILDTSDNMSNALFTRDYENLNTYAVLTELPLDQASYNMLHDGDNPYNEKAWLEAGNTYSKRKYIEDPNNPGIYVYIAAKDRRNGYTVENNNYTYTFTDNYGNVWESDEIEVSLVNSVWISGTRVNQIEFHLVSEVSGLPDDFNRDNVTITSIYTREDNDDASYLNKNLYAYSTEADGPGLYYKHTNGKFYPVEMHRTTKTYNGQTFATKYEYSVTLDDGTTYTAIQGNEQYGADYGVFQGFRSYEYDNEGDLTLDSSGNNLLSKSLYVYTGDNATTVTAFQAMKESLEEFLLSAHYQSLVKKSTVNIALITYDKTSTVQYTLDKTQSNYTYVKKSVGDQSIDNMISAIYNYSVTDTYASELGEAMGTAYDEMSTYSATGNRRFGAVFTAGVPAEYTTFLGFDTSDATFDTDIADTAIYYSYLLKNSLGTTMYSVGLFDNAEETKVNGKYWYYAFSEKVPCSGNVGSYWGGSWLSNYGFSMDPKDAYATNRMLAYISSDAPSATYLGLTRGKYSPSYSGWFTNLITRGTGYRIDRNFTLADTGYYFGVSPKHLNEDATSEDDSGSSLSASEVNAILTNVFAELNAATAIPNSNLTDTATLVDGITEYFQMVDGAEVTAYAADYNTGAKVSDLTAEVSDDGDTVSVTGFDYSSHYVGSGSDQKVVVQFDITRADDFIGGNDIATNLPKSGVYDGDDLLEETFDIPHVDVSILMDEVTNDDAVYYGCDEYLPDLLEEKWVDGTNNAFVDIVYTFKDANGTTINTYTIPAGESVGTWDRSIESDGTNAEYVNYQMLDTSEITVECTVTPTVVGTVEAKTILDENEEPYTSTVYVFKPHFDVNNDTVEAAGDTYDLTGIPTQSWIGYDANDAELTGDELTTAESYLSDKTMPDYTFDITLDGTTVVSVAAELDGETGEYTYTATPSDYDGTAINETTDFYVDNVNVTPTAFTYESEEVVTRNYYSTDDGSLLYSYDVQTGKYYDATGAEADTATAEAAISGLTAEEETGIVTKTVNRDAVDASTNEDVTYLNTDDERTTGAFTISLNGFDVTITNHTVKSESSTYDYADKTKEFPLTLTLTKNGDPVTGDIDFIDEDGNTTTITFDENGQAVINLKDGETVTLKEVTSGAILNIASDPDDEYYVLYQVGETSEDLTALEDENEAVDITINGTKVIDVTHSIDDIVVTGVGDDNVSSNILIALAVMATLSAGGYGIYRINRAKKETE